MSTTSPDKNFNIYRAELDGETVLVIVPMGEEPSHEESQKNLDWQKIICTGRKILSKKEHRQFDHRMNRPWSFQQYWKL
jgi:hypothetical protein